ncbi:hypothetical protein G6F32_017305 [Rhizopus arrhizus]|nr:hypothetical protein G6F32_017305 [Rhizopus arrhizus]
MRATGLACRSRCARVTAWSARGRRGGLRSRRRTPRPRPGRPCRAPRRNGNGSCPRHPHRYGRCGTPAPGTRAAPVRPPRWRPTGIRRESRPRRDRTAPRWATRW